MPIATPMSASFTAGASARPPSLLRPHFDVAAHDSQLVLRRYTAQTATFNLLVKLFSGQFIEFFSRCADESLPKILNPRDVTAVFCGRL
jgi:hypothetical protein